MWFPRSRLQDPSPTTGSTNGFTILSDIFTSCQLPQRIDALELFLQPNLLRPVNLQDFRIRCLAIDRGQNEQAANLHFWTIEFGAYTSD
jgi:hypothetical protein